MLDSATTGAREPRPMADRLACSSLLALAAVLLAAGCEDNALGRPCDLRADASVSAAQGAYNMNAPDCPSHLCTKPAVQPGISTELTTGPYCTVRCSSDSDCAGQTRDFNNPNDTRCLKGFACAIPFGAGALCCAKLCLCRDFFVASVGPATPEACQSGSTTSCQ